MVYKRASVDKRCNGLGVVIISPDFYARVPSSRFKAGYFAQG